MLRLSYNKKKEILKMKLKELRLKNNLTQQEIADILGCSTVAYSRYETGKRQPSTDMLISLSKILHVSIDYILENDNYSDDFINLEPLDREIIKNYHNADTYDQIAVLRILNIKEKDDKLKEAK